MVGALPASSAASVDVGAARPHERPRGVLAEDVDESAVDRLTGEARGARGVAPRERQMGPATGRSPRGPLVVELGGPPQRIDLPVESEKACGVGEFEDERRQIARTVDRYGRASVIAYGDASGAQHAGRLGVPGGDDLVETPQQIEHGAGRRVVGTRLLDVGHLGGRGSPRLAVQTPATQREPDLTRDDGVAAALAVDGHHEAGTDEFAAHIAQGLRGERAACGCPPELVDDGLSTR